MLSCFDSTGKDASRAKEPGSRSRCRMEIIWDLSCPKTDLPDGYWLLDSYTKKGCFLEIQKESVSIINVHTEPIIWISFNREQLLLSAIVVFLS
jgi:hypothetical protein